MGIVFAVRGDSLTARYSGGYNTGTKIIPSVVSVASDSGALSGSLINLTDTTANKGVWYSGKGNTGETQARSILLRMKANYTGTPSTGRALYQLGSSYGANGPNIMFWHASSSGQMTVFLRNYSNSICLSSVTFGSWSPTSGTYYDIVFTCTGTTASNGAKVYIDGTLLGQATLASALDTPWLSEYFGAIYLGTTNSVPTSAYYLDEFVIWDEVIDPTSVTLVSGSGSLNGASRTSLVSASSFNGSSYSDPGIANVSNGVSYTHAGSTLTGTLQTVTNTISNTTLSAVGPLSASLAEV